MLETLKKALRLFERDQRRFLPVLFILMLIGSGFEVIGVSMMVPLVAIIMDPGAASGTGTFASLLKFIPEGIRQHFISYGMVTLIAVFFIKTAYLAFEYRVQYRFVYRNRFLVQRKLLNAYLSRPYEDFLSIRTGEMLRVINSDVTTAFDMVMTLLFTATELTISTVLIITIFAISPFMTLFFSIAMLVTTFVISHFLRPVMREQGRRRNKASTQTNKWLLQSVNGIKEIKIGRKEDFFEDNYLVYGQQAVTIDQKQGALQQMPRLLIEMISVSSMLGIIAVMNARGATAEELIPALSAFAMAAVKLMPSANRIIGSLNRIAYSTHSVDRVLENLEAAGHVGERKRGDGAKVEVMPFNKELRFDGISYRYPDTDTDVLTDASFTIKRGESVGIVGPSGAGKTTAVDIMLGLLEPYEGKVTLDGVDIKSNYQGWLAHIGYIPQTIFMLDDTIRANIAFGCGEDDQDEDRIWEALEEAQLAEFVRGLPDGLETQIGERGVRLSGGQRQRIGIARALYESPDVLFFDEATSALDNETEAEVMEAVYGLKGKRTIIIVAHRLTTIERCDHVFEVRDRNVIQKR